eukprot:6198266-Pleurochrysis_carterae.AAC.2
MPTARVPTRVFHFLPFRKSPFIERYQRMCRKQISDARKVQQLLKATTAAARNSIYYVELLYATALEVRAQLLLQVRQKAIARTKKSARAAGVEYKAPTILKKDIEPHVPVVPDKVRKIQSPFTF